MEYVHLALTQLSVSAANMRAGRRAPDVADLIPSIKARGVLMPLLVRPSADAGFEIVAGRRRYHATLAIAEEGGEAPLLPCAILAEQDDAAALEASIIENYAREDPDEVTQWESFTRLVKEGRSVGEIAATFGMEDRGVKRVLALGNLLPRIRQLYAKREIDAQSIRHLTLASRAKQLEWLALYRDPDRHAPMGQQLRNWLLGGQSISAKVALFDLARYPDPILTDLFGDDQWFSNAESFWTLQREAMATLRQNYIDRGWADVVLLEAGQYFQRWEHRKFSKASGGRIYISVTRQGEVEAHEGWLTQREAQKRERGETEPVQKVEPRELTASLQAYVDLHRHAMVQAALVQNSAAALRLMLAHAIAGSWLWKVEADPLRAPTPAIAESHERNPARDRFAHGRAAAVHLLGQTLDGDSLVSGLSMDMGRLFQHLLALSDEDVLAIIAVVMAESMAVGSDAVEAAGVALAIDPATCWQADDAFLALLRRREILLTLIGDAAGADVAAGNAHVSAKTLRGILHDCLAGANGRPKAEHWVPRWLRFPAKPYFVHPAEAIEPETEDGDADDVDANDDVALAIKEARTVAA